MKHNGHITQTQNNVADFGEGFPSSSGYSSFQSDYYKRQVPSTRTPSAEYNEIAVRYVYAQKIFAIKRSGTTFNYNKFFSDAGAVNVDEHEVVTAGQMADYLMRPTLGLMDLQVGPVMGASNENMYSYFSDSNSYVAGTGVFALPNESTYQGKSLIGKLTEIFNRLFNNNGDDAGFHIHAKSFTGGSLSIGAITSADGSYVNLNAGTSSSFTNPILSVIGQNGTNIREIIVRKNNNDSTDKPVGIAGGYETGDSFSDYSLSDPMTTYKYTFMDFDRYYIRNNSTGRHQVNANMAWIDGYTSGPTKLDIIRFNFSYYSAPGSTYRTGRVLIYRPQEYDVQSYLIQGNYGGPQTINLHTSAADSGFNFIFGLKKSASITDGTGGIALSKYDSPLANYLIRVLNDGTLAFRNSITMAGNNIRLPFVASPISASAYSILTSEGEQKIRNTIDTTYRPYTTFTNSSDSVYVSNGVTSNGTYCQYNMYLYGGYGIGFGHYLKTPRLNGNADFLITNPFSTQNISGGLTINGFNVATEKYFIKPKNITAEAGVANGTLNFYIKYNSVVLSPNTYYAASIYTISDDSGDAKIAISESGYYDIFFDVSFDRWNSTTPTHYRYESRIYIDGSDVIKCGSVFQPDHLTSFTFKSSTYINSGSYIKFQIESSGVGASNCTAMRTCILITKLSS